MSKGHSYTCCEGECTCQQGHRRNGGSQHENMAMHATRTPSALGHSIGLQLRPLGVPLETGMRGAQGQSWPRHSRYILGLQESPMETHVPNHTPAQHGYAGNTHAHLTIASWPSCAAMYIGVQPVSVVALSASALPSSSILPTPPSTVTLCCICHGPLCATALKEYKHSTHGDTDGLGLGDTDRHMTPPPLPHCRNREQGEAMLTGTDPLIDDGRSA